MTNQNLQKENTKLNRRKIAILKTNLNIISMFPHLGKALRGFVFYLFFVNLYFGQNIKM